MPNYTVPPVNYNAFGSVINQPDSPQDYVNTSRAQIIEPPAPINTTGYDLSADIPAAQSQRAEVVEPDRFTTFIESVEKWRTSPGKTPLRYKSPEGGLDTIGIGHKLTQTEIDNNAVHGFDLDTLTKEQARAILKKDLPEYKSMLKADLKNNYKNYKMKQPIDYDTLDPKRQEMLLDFTFNLGGLKKFPKFTEAVLKGDMATAKKEYKRKFTDDKGVTKELKDRNEQFYNTYLK